ncbi:MAG TPA: sigma-E factor regulatory protein RseB domain-containing protein [Nitriliruptorales bacterium]|nr:sigma-E factor regulatory protein RseB domain-containing protein [Nitriliruptorales bacterium]
MSRGATAVLCVATSTLCFVTVLALAPPVTASEASTSAPEDGRWRELLERAVDAGRQRVFEGRLVVVSFEREGPTIGELQVVQDRDGSLLTDRTRDWMLRSADGETFYGNEQTGTRLRIGSVERTGFSVERLSRKYDVRLAGDEEVAGREAVTVVVRQRGSHHVRERLYVDRRSGLIVRRETFDGRGRPVRLTAFTSLDLSPQHAVPDVGVWEEERRSPHAAMSTRSLGILEELGWVLPDDLPGGFALVDASAVGQGDGSSVHLLYSDGLYSLSLYQQHGRLDIGAVATSGARPDRLGELPVLRWPDTDPGTYLWSGHGLTFTLVTDAPRDTLAQAVSDLPRDPPPSVGRRFVRGLTRVLHWVWPFD